MKMYKFESLYAEWMRLKRKQKPDQEALNNFAQKLITFLLENRKRQGNGE